MSLCYKKFRGGYPPCRKQSSGREGDDGGWLTRYRSADARPSSVTSACAGSGVNVPAGVEWRSLLVGPPAPEDEEQGDEPGPARWSIAPNTPVG